jgi:hypothetical protein
MRFAPPRHSRGRSAKTLARDEEDFDELMGIAVAE